MNFVESESEVSGSLIILWKKDDGDDDDGDDGDDVVGVSETVSSS